VDNNVLFIHIFIDENGEYRKFVIYTDRIILPNGKSIGIDKLKYIHGVIRRYGRIYEYRRTGGKTRLLEHSVPIGEIIFEYNNEKYSVNVLNPLNKVEELVLRINAIFMRLGLNKFVLSKSSDTEITYSRT
jgi:hypothetical protein